MRAAEHVLARRRLTVTGVVQGVGFRPFVHRLATQLGLDGFVGNDSSCVFIEVEGDDVALDAFTASLTADAPPLAQVDEVRVEVVPTIGAAGGGRFEIVESARSIGARTLVPPDVAVCDECMAEVLDPGDRRYRYPFANCTNCGPRFTIIRDLPYDRPSTTMSGFPLCAACAAEYHDPTDRRYHAQPIACPICGPQLALVMGDRCTVGTDAVIAEWQHLVAGGSVVAMKGVGGFHLACDATSYGAVLALRERKGRADKPFAVMVADLDAARRYAHIDDEEAAALRSPARPIVLVRRRDDAPLSATVAPGNPLVGLMLPYTPLHHLLFRAVPGSDAPVPDAVVMTSGNLSNEPICTDDHEARIRLAGVADAFLLHDRPIHVPCDDSVVRVVDARVQPVRRSRGYAPLPVALPVDVLPTLAVGGELKNTCCIASGRQAWMSQHIGDMENLETLDAFGRTVDGFRRMYGIDPEVVAVDGHPAYLTRRWALEHAVAGTAIVTVQHHHAHVAAAMAEHGLDGTQPVLGFAFDGTGHGIGDDGGPEVWGGEALLADYDGFERIAHLQPMPLPGGDAAVQNPCRVAVAYLTALGIPLDPAIPSVAACDSVELVVIRRLVERGLGCAQTTSMGRLFDVVASLLDVRHRVSYEAQAAIELEALASSTQQQRDLGFAVQGRVVGVERLLSAVVDAVCRGEDRAALAYAFHAAVARSVADVAIAHTAATGVRPPVALTGGVFQNALLTRLTADALTDAGFEVLTHRLVPANDGGLALGQAIVAGRWRS